MKSLDELDDAALVRLESDLRGLARSLARRPEQADDLVQEAWLAALSARNGKVRDLQGWMRSVMRYTQRRLRRRESMRGSVEQEAQEDRLGEVQPPDSLMRWEDDDALRSAVGSLGEPYRTVILLHYFEGLSTPAMAERLDRPLATVRSQLQRGLRQLRERVPLELEGERPGWRSLVPWFLLSWGGLRGERGRSALWLGLTAAVVATTLVLTTPEGTRPLDPSIPVDAVTTTATLDGERNPEPASPTPSLRDAGEQVATPTATPAADGGLVVGGRVTDRFGTAFADAELLLHLPGHRSRVVGRTGPGGSFELGGLAVGDELFAKVPGVQPTRWTRVDRRAINDDLILYVEQPPYGGPDGQVLSAAGPVAGATVRFVPAVEGRPILGPDNRWRGGVHRFELRSDEDGRFPYQGGSARLAILAEGFAPVVRPAFGQGFEHRLEPACELAGIVLGPGGEPAADVAVTVPQPSPLDDLELGTDPEGRFWTDRATPGATRVLARSPGGAACGNLRLVPGETAQVELRLRSEAVVRGRVVDGTGRALAEHLVLALPTRLRPLQRLLDEELARRAPVRTDASGTFALPCVDDGPLDLWIVTPDRSGPIALARDVRPGTEPLTLRAPRRASVAGAFLLDAPRRTLGDAILLRAVEGGWLRWQTMGREGSFRIDGLLPGRYELYLRTSLHSLPLEAGTLDLAPGQDLQLGRVPSPEPGRVRLNLHRGLGELRGLRVRVKNDWSASQWQRGSDDPIEPFGPRPVGGSPAAPLWEFEIPLPPGDYTLWVDAEGFQTVESRFRLEPGEDLELEESLHPGGRTVTLALEAEAGLSPDTWYDWRIEPASGPGWSAEGREHPLGADRAELVKRMPPGRYRALVSTQCELRGTLLFEVTADGRRRWPLRLRPVPPSASGD